jgi:hypothetical protein
LKRTRQRANSSKGDGRPSRELHWDALAADFLNSVDIHTAPPVTAVQHRHKLFAAAGVKDSIRLIEQESRLSSLYQSKGRGGADARACFRPGDHRADDF